MRKINEAGLKLIEEFEGLRLKAYQDSVGVWTIGWGSTRNVKRGMVITRAEAEERLRDDLSTAEKGVEDALTEEVTDNQFAACVSLAFNIGVVGFKKSSIVKFINSGDILLASDRFLLYNRGGGKVIAGLTRRRKAERALFMTEDEEPRTAPIKNGTVEPAKESTTETIKTTTVEETPEGTKTEETSLVSKIASNESVKTIASEGVTKLAAKATTALTAGSTASATGGSVTGKTWLIVLSVVLAVGAIAVVIFLLWHKSSKEKEAARINSDKDRADIAFAKK